MKKTSIVAASFILMFGFSTSAHALIPNGDFETGDLTGYTVQEDFVDVASSPLVTNVDDGTGNHVGQLDTGFTDLGVTTSSLISDFGALPSDVQDLVFDVKFIDVGQDIGPIFALENSPEFIALDVADPDILVVSLESNNNLSPFFFQLTSSGYSADPGVGVQSLSNGFYRVTANVSGYQGDTNGRLYFDLRDGDDQRLSRVQVDNIDLKTLDKSVVPEPATMLLIGGGILGAGYLRRKKVV